jgi:hypothetical protein
LGLEKFHPFVSENHSILGSLQMFEFSLLNILDRHISENLISEGFMKRNQFIKAKICTKEQLLTIHTEEYLGKLYDSEYVVF